VLLLDNATATHLYLIAQEAFHNSLNHGRPRNVRISLRSIHVLVLRVQNDGVGMPSGPSSPEGLSLRIMRTRRKLDLDDSSKLALRATQWVLEIG
jgi:signal transduction histidine kinase